MAGMQHFTSEAMIDALKQTNGLVSLAARKIGCAPKTIYQRAKDVHAVKQAIDDCREELVDIAELALRACLTNREPWAVAITLRTLGKNRGYVERQEVTGADGGPVGIAIREVVIERTEAAKDE
jgi:hypothetical protein